MSTVASIRLSPTPRQEYLLRIADTCLIHAQRISEWSGHAPVLEEDIALTNFALDLVGQARALLTHVGAQLGHDEDQLAFLRDERDFRNLTLVELPGRRGGRDFADLVLRNFVLSAWLNVLWAGLESSSDAEVAAIAGKAVKESRYHVAHSAEWVVRLGDGTDESAQRMARAVERTWPYVAELFEADGVDAEAARTALGPARASLRDAWQAIVGPVLADARLAVPEAGQFRSTGSRGVHSEHMGYILAEMQTLQRSFPGWRVVSAMAAAAATQRVQDAWRVLHEVPDPEVPAISVTDLGIVRDVIAHDDGLEVVVTPTYSGCPATEVIAQSIADAVHAAGLGPARVTQRRAPAWTTDWISPEGREKLRKYGIAPPGSCAVDALQGKVSPVRLMARNIDCPRCGSSQTERLAAFGSTACKALYRCVACREPFEYFKPI